MDDSQLTVSSQLSIDYSSNTNNEQVATSSTNSFWDLCDKLSICIQLLTWSAYPFTVSTERRPMKSVVDRHETAMSTTA